MISQGRLHEVLHYAPGTGVFTWRVQLAPRGKVGARAGYTSRNNRGRVEIRVDGCLYLAHRLAWLYVTGDWPDVIDHIDGDPGNNRLANLRDVSQMQNVWNSKPRSDNTSGVKGVRFDPARKKWSARLKVDGKFVLLRRFETKEEAIAAREEAAAKHHGEFARAA